MDCSMMISSGNDCTGGKVEFQSPTYLTDAGDDDFDFLLEGVEQLWWQAEKAQKPAG